MVEALHVHARVFMGVAVIGIGLFPLVECYPYMQDLKELDQRSSCLSSHEIPRILTSIS